MTMHGALVRRATVALATLVLIPAGLSARQAGDLPPATEIIDRYHKAIGGKERLGAFKSARSVGTFEMPAAGLRGEVESFIAKPNRMFVRVKAGGMGEMLSGFNGEVGWSINAMEGPRVFQGDELKQMMDQADYDAQYRLLDRFDTVETVEKTEYNGEACYKVRLVWKSGRESFDCYSVETGLLIASVAQASSPMGTIEVTSIYTDYKDFGGVKMPTRTVQRMMGMEQIFTVTEVEFDNVSDSTFDLPEQIRALIGG